MAALSVPIPQSSGGGGGSVIQGTPIQFQSGVLTTQSDLQILLQIVVPELTQRFLYTAVIVCNIAGVVEINYTNTQNETILIGSDRTEAGVPKAVFTWWPPYQAGSGTLITITFQIREGAPQVPIEAYLMCSDVTV